MQSIVGAIVALVVIVGVWFVYTNNKDTVPMQAQQPEGQAVPTDMGWYPYKCSNGSDMIVTLSSDMQTIEVTLHDAPIELTKVAGDGARYEGNGSTFVGAGEEVTFTINGLTLTCNPVPQSDMAPFNWGDTAEGGGVKQNVAQIVSESIVGKWQSNEDGKFVREFKSGDVVTDWYNNTATSSGLWVAFTKANPPKQVAFGLEDGVVYLKMTVAESQGDTLYFKVIKLTPENLELINMDRGNSLTFTRVQ